MRILIVLQFYLDGSGSGIYVQNEAREMLALGHDVWVVAPNVRVDVSRPFHTSTVLFMQPMSGPMTCDHDVPYFTTHPVSAVRFVDLADAQLEHYISLWRLVLKQQIEAFRPDVIHCHHASVAASILSEQAIPYVITLHGTDLIGFKTDPRLRESALKGVMGAYRLISISNWVTEEAISVLGVSADRFELIHNGYNEALFYPLPVSPGAILAKHYLEGSPSAIVCFAGRLAHFKGIDLLIRAATLYEQRVPGVLTLIVGHGHLRAELETLAAELDVQGIRFLGALGQKEVAELYTIADVSVVPSRHEPFGLVALEALACGTPVVGTCGGGLPDFIDDRVGRLVPLEDWQALGEAIAGEILAQTKASKGVFAARYAREGFSWKRSVPRMATLMQSAIGSAPVSILG